MLSKTFLVVLLVGAVVVQDADAWWSRRLGDFIKTVGIETSAMMAMGKRGGLDGAPTSPQEIAVTQQQLQRDCPVLYDPQGVKHDKIQAAFTESDEDGDGALTGDEMSAFAEIMKAIGACKDLYEDSLPATTEISQTDV